MHITYLHRRHSGWDAGIQSTGMWIMAISGDFERPRYHPWPMDTCFPAGMTISGNYWVLAILCDFKDKPPRQVLQGIIQRLIELTANQSDKLRNYLKMMELLSINRDLEDTFKQVEKDMLSNIRVDQLPSYQIGMEKGIHIQATHTAKRMLKNDMDIATIHRLTELPLSEIEQIAAEMSGE